MATLLMEAPMCDKCAHRHEENERCKVCGHMGRRVIFPGPDDKHPPPATFRITHFDLTERTEEAVAAFRLALLMRGKVFIKELEMRRGKPVVAASRRRTEYIEQDDHDPYSRHMLGIIGDAPVTYGRWRVVSAPMVDPTAPEGSMIVVIDRLLTLKDRRKNGLGVAMLGSALADIYNMLSSATDGPILRISMFIPVCDECVNAGMTALKAGLTAHGDPRMDDPTGLLENETFIAKVKGVQEFAVMVPEFMAAVAASRAAEAAGGGAA